MTAVAPQRMRRSEPAPRAMRRVLLVSPNWPPMAFPDLHRLRMSLPYFRDNGWEPAVLCIDPAHRPGVRDDALAATLPDDVPVRRVRPLPSWITAPLRISGLTLRALPGLARAGDAMIRELGIDVVYISTTLSEVMALGRYWKARHGVPYVVDWQDPWYSDYYRQPGAPRPPGGRLRYAIANAVARGLEPVVLRGASQVIAVSAEYPRALRARYPWLEADRCCVIPFGASPEDFRAAARPEISQGVFTPGDGLAHWVYAGRVGDDMALAISSLLSAMAKARRDGRSASLERVRLHVIGGSYDPGDAAAGPVTRMAEAHGVADLVHEDRRRLPYLEALRCLQDADALVMFGSDDPGYAPSKLFPYVLAEKPLLALLHERSDAVGVLRRARACTVTFGSHEHPAAVADRVRSAWLGPDGPPATACDGEAVVGFTARALTRVQCERLDRAHLMANGGAKA